MTNESWDVKVVGVRVPRPERKVTGRIPPGRFEASGEVSFDGVTAFEVDFSGITFEHLVTEGSVFERCDFSRVRVKTGFFDSVRSSRFVACRFDRFQPGSALFGSCRFEDCTFTNVRLKRWWAYACEFVGCTFTGRIEDLQLSATPPAPWDGRDRLIPWRTTNEIRGNDFAGAELRYFEARNGVDLSQSRWPSGPEYLYLDRWPERARRARLKVLGWPDDAVRERALWWVDIHTSEGQELQNQLLIRMPDWERPEPRATWPKLWSTLVEVLP